MKRRPRVIYVSYDGAAEPLGVSQILSYLERLASDFAISLISFEKPDADREYVGNRLTQAGIDWQPQQYHASPRVASTALDIRTGTNVIDRIARQNGCDVLHVRSYVPALMAMRSGAISNARFLFDIRGFWADERVEGGLWPRGALYRIAKHYERRFFRRADAVVTLTEASVPYVQKMVTDSTPVQVIPTCVDLDRFVTPKWTDEKPVALWNGSIGTWYRFDLAPAIAEALDMPLVVLTRNKSAAEDALGGRDAEVTAVPPRQVPEHLGRPHIGLCLVQPSFSKTASAPTRLAEHLAAGWPVLVSKGVGDMESIATEAGVGSAIDVVQNVGWEAALERAKELVRDPSTLHRCAATARARFSADWGSSTYAAVYGTLLAGTY